MVEDVFRYYIYAYDNFICNIGYTRSLAYILYLIVVSLFLLGNIVILYSLYHTPLSIVDCPYQDTYIAYHCFV